MDREQFIHQYLNRKNNLTPHMNKDEYIKAHLDHLAVCDSRNPVDKLIIPIEEMSELTKEISKIIRGKAPADSTNYGLLEELADVQIILDSLKIIFNISEEEMKYAIDVKVARNNARIHDQKRDK